jgi:hypothetical protein
MLISIMLIALVGLVVSGIPKVAAAQILTDTSGNYGAFQQVYLYGVGFWPRETIDVGICPPAPQDFGCSDFHTNADSNGAIDGVALFGFPSNYQPRMAGQYYVDARGLSSGLEASTTFQVCYASWCPGYVP